MKGTRGKNGVWVSRRTGKPLNYTNWYDTKPNHKNDNEHCVAVLADSHQANEFGVQNFRWIDLDCPNKKFAFFKEYSIKFRALCEKDVGVIGEVPVLMEKVLPSIGENGCLEGWTKLATETAINIPRGKRFL